MAKKNAELRKPAKSLKEKQKEKRMKKMDEKVARRKSRN